MEGRRKYSFLLGRILFISMKMAKSKPNKGGSNNNRQKESKNSKKMIETNHYLSILEIMC